MNRNLWLVVPENEKHASRKLFENDDYTIKMCFSKFGHQDQIIFSDSCCKQHTSASPNERPLQEKLAKCLVICRQRSTNTKGWNKILNIRYR